MTGYTKLFSSILDSTIWQEDAETRVVWITMLAMSDQHGEVPSSIPGLAKRAGVALAVCEKALLKFLSPDPYSRTPDFEGRRIEKMDGGWRLLNYLKYRERATHEDQRRLNADRQRRFKERRGNAPVTVGNAPVTANNGNSTEAEAEAEALAHKQKASLSVSSPTASPPPQAKEKLRPVFTKKPEQKIKDTLAQDFIKTWCDRNLAAGRKSPTITGRDAGAAQTLARDLPREEWQKCFDAFIKDNEPFVANNGHALWVLPMRVDKYRNGDRAEYHQFQPVTRRCRLMTKEEGRIKFEAQEAEAAKEQS
jgi:hypothetical protein